ncbi:hypothetical protein [Aphanothece sacrum]|uniref:Uncharacterized protein n=1 Tax=Aphanothece sacrum FPU1 TaxID=1920663 RepID=A0A401IJ70_APHSA|nr:hypothetical protein [Aphanothece sacrum]GBF81151.1 hypothetical protein AsFPU1_2563 [Aphanothece sacrum FPU1]GBF83501.1 hypothetical protein AsFPU3_0543 [Aphanothece sacrum FPU3]
MFNSFRKKHNHQEKEKDNSNTQGSIVITFPRIIILFSQETFIKWLLVVIFSVGGINYFKPMIDKFLPNINMQPNLSEAVNNGENDDK